MKVVLALLVLVLLAPVVSAMDPPSVKAVGGEGTQKEGIVAVFTSDAGVGIKYHNLTSDASFLAAACVTPDGSLHIGCEYVRSP